MEEEIYTWIGVLGFALAVIALLFSFISGGTTYNFNQTQFIENGSNISINQTWVSDSTNLSNYIEKGTVANVSAIEFNYNATCHPSQYFNGTGLIINVTGC